MTALFPDYDTASEGGGEGPAPRRVQDKALNLTWFRGGGGSGDYFTASRGEGVSEWTLNNTSPPLGTLGILFANSPKKSHGIMKYWKQFSQKKEKE